MSEPTPPATSAAAPPALSFETRFALMRSVGEECISEDDLKNLLQKKPNIRCYDGFEPSGRMHIAQGIFKAINVNKCTRSGCEFVFWVADWFALMNDKVGGDIDKIRIVGKYLLEVWKGAGMDMTNVSFLWSSEEINKHAEAYWKIVLDIGRRNSIARIKKCCTIMGKTEGTLSAAQILYPLMQCADIFFLKADVCQLGLDQRKVNMLAREYCDLIGRKLKPVILSHHMMAGLKKGQVKASKSDPDSAIFMEDSREEVARKIEGAHCPRVAQKVAAEVADDGLGTSDDNKNPVLDYIECVVFGVEGATFTVPGAAIYTSYQDCEAAFLGEIFTADQLKQGLINAINAMLDPVRAHFASDNEAKKLLELVMTFRSKTVTPAPPASDAKEYTPDGMHLVAWVPATTKLPLNTALKLVHEANLFASKGGKVSIVQPDWSSAARDDVTGEEKYVTATLEFNTELLRALGLSSQATIAKQGAHMLKNSDGYWITAINAGRKLSLGDIDPALGGEVPNAGSVIACLMRVADAITLGSSHVLTTLFDLKQHQLISNFSKGAIVEIPIGGDFIPMLSDPKLPLAVPANPDDTLFADDSDVDIKRKIKRAYCAPNEVENSIVKIAEFTIGSVGSITISRPEANGGNIQFDSSDKMLAMCLDGTLHPGDLKPAVQNAVLELTKAVRAQTATAELKKISAMLRQAEKNMLKKK